MAWLLLAVVVILLAVMWGRSYHNRLTKASKLVVRITHQQGPCRVGWLVNYLHGEGIRLSVFEVKGVCETLQEADVLKCTHTGVCISDDTYGFIPAEQ